MRHWLKLLQEDGLAGAVITEFKILNGFYFWRAYFKEKPYRKDGKLNGVDGHIPIYAINKSPKLLYECIMSLKQNGYSDNEISNLRLCI